MSALRRAWRSRHRFATFFAVWGFVYLLGGFAFARMGFEVLADGLALGAILASILSFFWLLASASQNLSSGRGSNGGDSP